VRQQLEADESDHRHQPAFGGHGPERFGFSSAADPMLVARYGDSWNALHDRISTAHLFGIGGL